MKTICTRKTKYPSVIRDSHLAVGVPDEGFYVVMDARCSQALVAATRRKRAILAKTGLVLRNSSELAITEARRLAEEHGLPYVVLQSVALLEPSSSQHVYHPLTPH